MTTVISHLSALRAIRRARRAYSALPWDSVDSEQQAQALAGCIPNNDAIDFGALSILDAWNEDDSELLDLLVSNEDNRRPDKRLLQHILSAPLPEGAIMHVEADIYATSPAMTAMLCSKNESVAKTLMLLMELLGTYSLPPGQHTPLPMTTSGPRAMAAQRRAISIAWATSRWSSNRTKPATNRHTTNASPPRPSKSSRLLHSLPKAAHTPRFARQSSSPDPDLHPQPNP